MPKAVHEVQVVQVRGTIVALNMSPKGQVEGVLVKSGKDILQVNLPKHAEPALSASFVVGAKVDLRTESDVSEGDHPVHRLVEPEADVTGKVVRLNYALHGEVNGFHLADGTFVHLKPEGAAKHKVRVGETVAVSGARKTGPDASVIDAREVKRVRPRGAEASTSASA